MAVRRGQIRRAGHWVQKAPLLLAGRNGGLNARNDICAMKTLLDGGMDVERSPIQTMKGGLELGCWERANELRSQGREAEEARDFNSKENNLEKSDLELEPFCSQVLRSSEARLSHTFLAGMSGRRGSRLRGRRSVSQAPTRLGSGRAVLFRKSPSH